MPEIGTSGSMSGDGKRSVGHRPQATAPILDSTIGSLAKIRLDGVWPHVRRPQRIYRLCQMSPRALFCLQQCAARCQEQQNGGQVKQQRYDEDEPTQHRLVGLAKQGGKTSDGPEIGGSIRPVPLNMSHKR